MTLNCIRSNGIRNAAIVYVSTVTPCNPSIKLPWFVDGGSGGGGGYGDYPPRYDDRGPPAYSGGGGGYGR